MNILQNPLRRIFRVAGNVSAPRLHYAVHGYNLPAQTGKQHHRRISRTKAAAYQPVSRPVHFPVQTFIAPSPVHRNQGRFLFTGSGLPFKYAVKAKRLRPGLRRYTGYKDMPRVLNGLGIAILSTSKGVMTNKKARDLKIGGEVLCYVY